MSLPLNGPIVIAIPNAAPAGGEFKCVASFRGQAAILAEATEAVRADALDAVIAALRVHPLGDLTLLPLLITTGGRIDYKWI